MAVPTEPEDRVEGIDPRMRSAWRSWLGALATDAEAAMAAALAYESLPEEGRDAWLDALEADAQGLDVPAVALYAPLLAIESDEGRRARMRRALMARGVDLAPPGPARALHGVASSGEHVCVVISPLYLDFVEVLVCRYHPDAGFVSARRDPVRHVVDVLGVKTNAESTPEIAASHPGCTVDGVVVTEAPLRLVVEELAHAVVADRREGREAPAALSTYAHLFGPDLETPPASRP